MLAVAALPTPGLARQAPPDDPLLPRQWALETVGAPCAWALETGSQAVTVAVVDSGVDLEHPDLVDRVRGDGFDFVDNDDLPRDENGHGTHVAGIIAAALGNGEGGAGLAPDVQILPVRVMNAEGVGSDRAIAAGITYAVDKGAQVINLSLGATLLLATPDSSPQVARAIRNALANDVVVVVAAGNDFVPLPNAIVGENADVLVVAASDQSDLKAPFSNSGPWVAVTAPGTRILSTMPTYEVFLTSAELPAEERFTQDYDTMSGTSQAAPFVSALAALLRSAHPEWSAAEVREAITGFAVDIYPNHPSYYRRLRLLGSGRVDACASVSGEASVANPWLDVVRQGGVLPLAAGAAGLCLLAVAVVGVGVGLATRRRRSPTAVPVPPPPAPIQPTPPPSVPIANTGDTLVGAAVAWGLLRVVSGSEPPKMFVLAGERVLIGRDHGCEVQLAGDPTVSRRHANLLIRGGLVLIEDLGSSHGTFVGGQRIQTPVALRPGDTFTVGGTTLRFER
jgi:subtilisin family serine protease